MSGKVNASMGIVLLRFLVSSGRVDATGESQGPSPVASRRVQEQDQEEIHGAIQTAADSAPAASLPAAAVADDRSSPVRAAARAASGRAIGVLRAGAQAAATFTRSPAVPKTGSPSCRSTCHTSRMRLLSTVLTDDHRKA